MSAALAFIVGVAGVCVGAALTNVYALRRERRAELTSALDRLVHALTSADHALNNLIAQVGTRKPESITQAAADRVTTCEIEIRAAYRSMILRLKFGHGIEGAFRDVQEAYTQAWMALEDAILANGRGTWNEEADAAIVEAMNRQLYFQGSFAAAIDIARVAVGAGA